MILLLLGSGCIKKPVIAARAVAAKAAAMILFVITFLLLSSGNSILSAAKQLNPFNSIIPQLPASRTDNSFAPFINPVFPEIIPNPSFSYMLQDFEKDGALLKSPDFNHFFLADIAGFLFSYSWIERMRYGDSLIKPDANLFTIGKGFFFSDMFGLGLNYSFSKSKKHDFDKYKSLSFGLLFRPAGFISFGYTARDINNPEIAGMETARSDIYSLSLKPFNVITFSVDAVKYENRDFDKSDVFVAANLHLKYNITAFGSINKEKDFTFGMLIPFGLNGSGSSTFILDAYTSDISGIRSTALGATIASGKTRSPLLETRRYLKIKLDKTISETRTESLFGKDEVIFYDLVNAVDSAGKDTSISGIILQIDDADLGFAQIQELRDQISQFRKTNKKIYAILYGEGNKEYYLAAACDKIYYLPSEPFAITGLKAEVLFFKGVLDKIGVKFESVRRGAYKSFPEPYTRDHMSVEFRENMTSLISDLNNQYLGDIMKDRNLSSGQIDELFKKGFLKPHEAVQEGFIDEIEYPVNAERKILESTGSVNNTVDLDDYAREKTIDDTWGPGSGIAVIYVTGSIIHGESKGIDFISARTIGDETYFKALRGAFEDNHIRAIVIRVDSGGGSSVASELMWHYLAQLKERYKKPVVFSFGNTAASGGYFIACTGDRIFSSAGTVTGSIGVVTGKISLKELYSKLGINKDVIKMSEFADIFSESKDMSPEERKVIEDGVDYVYNQFTEKVSEARQIEKNRINKIAEGRVFSGSQAKNNGLIDSYGGLMTAIELAKSITSLKDNCIIKHLPESPAPLMEFLGLTNETYRLPAGISLFQIFDMIEFKDEHNLYYCPYKIIIK